MIESFSVMSDYLYSLNPPLSIVVASRNDNHGGNILDRMRLFVDGLLTQTRRFRLHAELIFVEWNPPRDRLPLADILPAPSSGDVLEIRFVRVPEEIHNSFGRGREIPLYQMIAKNVGIRRAKGEFILCTNIDLLFSDELFAFLAKGELDADVFYRCNRVDVPSAILPEWTWEQKMAFCRKNERKRLGKDSLHRNLFGMKPWIYDYPVFSRSLNFAMKHVRKWMQNPVKRRLLDLDTNACGDFTLMSRKAWMDIGGYVELDLYSIHIDSLALVAAAALGYRQEILSREKCTYHMDHPAGWESMTPLEKVRFLSRRPGLGYDIVWEVGMQVLNSGEKFQLNGENWGFADLTFEEWKR